MATLVNRKTRLYTDLDLDFTNHPVTNDIVKKLDEEAVKRSVRNLILTNNFERPFHPEIGSGVTALLFEPANLITAASIRSKIEYTLDNFEPRAEVLEIKVSPDLDKNGFYVSIEFKVNNIINPVVIDFFLERLR